MIDDPLIWIRLRSLHGKDCMVMWIGPEMENYEAYYGIIETVSITAGKIFFNKPSSIGALYNSHRPVKMYVDDVLQIYDDGVTVSFSQIDRIYMRESSLQSWRCIYDRERSDSLHKTQESSRKKNYIVVI